MPVGIAPLVPYPGSAPPLTARGDSHAANDRANSTRRPASCIISEIFHMGEHGVKIAVCVKRVPDMDVRFRIASDGASLDETGVKFDLNDFDAWAVEAALQLKEKAGQGEVVVLSLGPNAVQETIRKALSMGAD